MLVYVGEIVTATVEGRTWREETCQHCGRRFHYLLTVTAAGQATNPNFLDSFDSRRRAADEARDRLDHELKHHVPPVPCPHCSKYQEVMVPVLRAARHPRVRTAGRYLVGVGGVILLLVLCFMLMIVLASSNPSALNWPAVAAILAVVGLPPAAGLGLLALRRRRLAAYDPNADAHAAERRRLAAECALTSEQFAALRVPVPPPGLTRLGPPPRPGQLVGKTCIRCGDRIPSELDGRFCQGCGWPVHNDCAVPVEGGCPRCGAGAPPA